MTLRSFLLMFCFTLTVAGCDDAAPIAEADAGTDARPPMDAPTAEDVALLPEVSSADAALDVAPARSCADGCPVGHECLGERCLRVSGLGDACGVVGDGVPPPLCARGTDCVRRDGRFQCVTVGSIGASCRPGSPHCDEGLGCDADATNTCVAALPEGAFCGTTTPPCVDGTHCNALDGTFRCRRDGAAGHNCRHPRQTAAGLDRSAPCDVGLTCTPTIFYHSPPGRFDAYEGICQRTVARGALCDARSDRCADGGECAATDGALRASRCVAVGSVGAGCLPSGTAGCPAGVGCCESGLVCSFVVSQNGYGCVRPVAPWATCDPTGRTTACPAGHTCSSVDPMDPGQCVPARVVPGSDCAAGVCDGDLVCDLRSRYRSTCRTVARAGDFCDLGAIRTQCPAGTLCLAAAAFPHGVPMAVCTAPISESEPNDTPASPVDAPAVSRLYAASFTPTDARDCFAVRVAEGASLRLELASVTAPTPELFQLPISLFDPSGVEVGRWMPTPSSEGPTGDLARLRPTEVPLLRALSAGTWSVCISRRHATETERYLLALVVIPPT